MKYVKPEISVTDIINNQAISTNLSDWLATNGYNSSDVQISTYLVNS